MRALSRLFGLLFACGLVGSALAGCKEDKGSGEGPADASPDTGAPVDETVAVKARCVNVWNAVCARAAGCRLITATSTDCQLSGVEQCCMGAYCVAPDDFSATAVNQCADAVYALSCEDLVAAADAAYPDRTGDVPLEEALFPATCAGMFRYDPSGRTYY